MSTRLCTRLVALLVLIALQGCSIFMTAPPTNHAELEYFDCTSSYAAPGTDMSLAGSAALSGALSVMQGQPELGGMSFGIAAIALLGGLHGISVANRCTAAQQEMLYRSELETQRQLDAIDH